MDQLHIMSVFVAVADLQGFAPAARKLHMSPPAVTRAIAALEESIGVKLLVRTTRHVKTTEAGQRYLQDARRILHEVERANNAVQGIHSEPKGLLRITAPVLFGQQHVLPVIVDYLNEYPETQVDNVLLDRLVNILEEGFDLGIRIGNLPDSSMHARLVGKVSLILVASPEYIQRHGLPKSPKDLQQHTVIASSAGDLTHDWHFEKSATTLTVRMHPRLTVNTNQAAINAARQHLGITRVISYQVSEDLAQRHLVTVLPDYQLAPLPVHIVHREGPNPSNKVRSFIDMLAERLKEEIH
jgi:DNA-binding transcriptional LysR family regulator